MTYHLIRKCTEFWIQTFSHKFYPLKNAKEYSHSSKTLKTNIDLLVLDSSQGRHAYLILGAYKNSSYCITQGAKLKNGCSTAHG